MDSFSYGARLNSFKLGLKDGDEDASRHMTLRLLARAATAGLTQMDLNFPDHFNGLPIGELKRFVSDNPVKINGLAMRYYTCLLYTSPSPRDRQKSRMPSSA